MHRLIIAASLGWALIASTASADSALPATTGTEACGHVAEMSAARKALDEERRADAIRHLKEARRLLAACDARLAAEGIPTETVDSDEGPSI